MKEFGKIVVAFFAVYGEMFRQFYICMTTDSDEFTAKQDAMFAEEASKAIITEEDND